MSFLSWGDDSNNLRRRIRDLEAELCGSNEQLRREITELKNEKTILRNRLNKLDAAISSAITTAHERVYELCADQERNCPGHGGLDSPPAAIELDNFIEVLEAIWET